MSRSCMWSLSFNFPHQNSVWLSLPLCTCHVHCLSHLWFDRQKKYLLRRKIMKLLIIHFSPVFCYSLRSEYFTQHSVFITLCVLSLMWETNIHTHTKQQTQLQLCIYSFFFCLGYPPSWLLYQVFSFSIQGNAVN
jgi:hypothetical protein